MYTKSSNICLTSASEVLLQKVLGTQEQEPPPPPMSAKFDKAGQSNVQLIIKNTVT